MSIYKKGRRKEYKICEELRKEGFDIVFRSAGSHSPIDVIGINTEEKRIKLIQSKRTLKESMDFVEEKLKAKIESENSKINGRYMVEFEVK